MTGPELVSDPDRITSEWLTRALRSNGVDATVTGFTAMPIGTGQLGENVRFTLSGSGDLPETVVGKFPSPDPTSRETGVNLMNYKREVHFYRHFRQRVNIQTPRVLHTDIDDTTHDFVILMEDLAPGVQGDQLAGCGPEEAALALAQLAHLHGPLWGDDTLVDGELVTNRAEDRGATADFYKGLMPGFLNRYRDRLDDDEQEMVRLVGANMAGYGSHYQGERTMIHFDYRLDNMMFGGPYPLAVVDWQSWGYDCGLSDASYFMGTSLREEERAAHDETLLRGYFNTLSEYQVALTWEDCWRFYRYHAPAGLIMAVIASMIVGETERGNDMFMAMAKRSARMCRDLDAIGAIGGS